MSLNNYFYILFAICVFYTKNSHASIPVDTIIIQIENSVLENYVIQHDYQAKSLSKLLSAEKKYQPNGYFIIQSSDSCIFSKGTLKEHQLNGLWDFYWRADHFKYGWTMNQPTTTITKQNTPMWSITFKQGVIDGKITQYWYDSDIKKVEVEIVNGKSNGIYREYNQKGQLISESQYLNGKKNGYAKSYLNTGVQTKLEHYENGKLNGLQYIYIDSNTVIEIIFKNEKEISRTYQ